MASTECGWCGRLAHMKAASNLRVFRDQWSTAYVQAAYVCPNCHQLNIATAPTQDYVERVEVHRVEVAETQDWDVVSWLPAPGQQQEFPDVPSDIAGAATEATLCLSLGAYRAVGALARAVIEATAKDQGAAGKDLYQRIEALAEGQHIRPHTKAQAHEIRHFGNDMAHGDFADPTTKEEATEIVELMSEVLNEVYQSPAKLARVKSARLARTESP